jgi:hypothetical protein
MLIFLFAAEYCSIMVQYASRRPKMLHKCLKFMIYYVFYNSKSSKLVHDIYQLLLSLCMSQTFSTDY